MCVILISEVNRLHILGNVSVLEGYPEGAQADEIERKIALTLPVIPGLVSELSSEDRLVVLKASVDESRAAFIKLYGNPFGCEIHSYEAQKENDEKVECIPPFVSA